MPTFNSKIIGLNYMYLLFLSFRYNRDPAAALATQQPHSQPGSRIRDPALVSLSPALFLVLVVSQQ